MATDWLTTVAAAVKRKREQSGWKVVNLADRTKSVDSPIHRVALKKLEDGERDYLTISELVGLAAALGVPPASLLFPDITETIEVLPGKPMRGVEAFGWFIGAGGPVGLAGDWAYAPEGVRTSQSMRIPLELLKIELELVEYQDARERALTGQRTATNDAQRKLLQDHADGIAKMITDLEHRRDLLIDEYKKGLPDA